MNNFSFNNLRIDGLATAVPNDVEQIMDYAKYYPEGELEKFCASTGIYQRYVGHRKKIIASDLCVAAANSLFEKFNLDKDNIDCLIYMSQSFDYESPATANIIQMRLGLNNCGAVYDITYGCAAFPFALQIAGSFINGGCRSVLILIGDSVTSPDITDKDNFLFGDAGSAMIISKAENEESEINIRLETLGNKFKALMFPFGKNRHRFYDMVNEVGYENANKLLKRFMSGADVFTFSLIDATKATKKFYSDFKCSADDFDLLAIHQANKMIIDNVAKKIKFPKEKVNITLDRYANTSGVSIPLAICDYFEKNSCCGIKNILTLGFGVGLSIGIASLKINCNKVLPIIKTDESFDDGLYCSEYLNY